MPYLTPEKKTKHTAAEKKTTQSATLKSGYCVIPVSGPHQATRMIQDVSEGLSSSPQKYLPCTYLYDAKGSELYEQITELAEYYPTRTETAILKQIAPELRNLTETQLKEPPEMVELGSGSSAKTRIILDAWQLSNQCLTYIPVDVSETMLSETASALTREYKQLHVVGLAGDYQDALNFLPAQRERLFLFLGGTIGNFSAESQTAFFQSLQHKMGSGSRLLLGYDRRPHATKTKAFIEAAYDDASGVTRDFNLNILAHINQKLGGNFELARWKHHAVYNSEAQQIEMYVESIEAQSVYLKALDRSFSFEAGERILTEISRKFDPQELSEWFEKLGFKTIKHWQDSAGWYGLLLLQA
ncbi:L-histidine N(alpha)-methyltransferase [Vampirovibrio sp.]|uniref:L-histidine N(alpha)-methyltransferase n=1 Tax=Vampirovibrio sp. TaxID=2717857 RepID=UPI003593ADF6